MHSYPIIYIFTIWTIKEKYQPIINCGKIVQPAEIIKIYNNDVLRS